MSSYSIELPARCRAWLSDTAYQVRLTEQARTLTAAASTVSPTQLRLVAASMPDTLENAQLAERDEVRVCFTFRVMEGSAARVWHHRRPRRAA